MCLFLHEKKPLFIGILDYYVCLTSKCMRVYFVLIVRLDLAKTTLYFGEYYLDVSLVLEYLKCLRRYDEFAAYLFYYN